MTTIMFQKRFVTPLLSGAKRQTIRPPRKRPIVVGEKLSLRHWYDKAYRSPQVEILKAECTAVFDITISTHGVQIGTGSIKTSKPQLDEFARGDGFESWAAMREFFESRFGYGLPFAGTLIQFEMRGKAQGAA